MNKKQLRVYAAKFEGASAVARLTFGIVALLGFLQLMNVFVSTTAMVIALSIYTVVLGFGYWWVRREWRALLAPLPKTVRKKIPAKAVP